MEAATQPFSPQHNSAAINRQVWAAANLMREGGFSTLDTIDHLTLLLFLRLFHGASTEGPPGIEGLGQQLKSEDPIASCLCVSRPIEHFERTAYRQLTELVSAAPPEHPVRAITDGFEFHIEDERLFKRLLELVQEVPLSTPDLNGLIYERLIATLSEAGHLGQYFTPRHIVDLMMSLVAPKPGESIYDPACGTGGFFVGAATYQTAQDLEPSLEVHGHEINRTVRRLCIMNLFVRGLDPSGIRRADALTASTKDTAQYDIVLSNPPFGGAVTSDLEASQYPIQTTNSEGLFLQHILASLRPGGRAAVVCPEGLLANIGGPATALRKYLMEQARVDAVVSLPGGVFNPYTAVRTGIVVFTKGEPTQRVWFFDVHNDGFDLGARRQPLKGSSLPTVLCGFDRRTDGDVSVTADRATIQAHRDRLVASRYLHDAKQGHLTASTPLGQVCDLIKDQIRPAEAPDRLFTYVAMEHIEPRSGQLLPVEPSRGKDIKSSKTRFSGGDILYGKLRPYLSKVILAEHDGICSTELLVLRPKTDLVRAGYLAEVLRSNNFTESAVAMTVGANHPRVHPRDLLGIRIPIPSLHEQDAVMSQVEAARTRIKESKSKIASANRDIERAIDLAWS
jgi:N-6 DNA Methylase/Type I restriction modification DNA specificity domain